jgi:hypothetical protein
MEPEQARNAPSASGNLLIRRSSNKYPGREYNFPPSPGDYTSAASSSRPHYGRGVVAVEGPDTAKFSTHSACQMNAAWWNRIFMLNNGRAFCRNGGSRGGGRQATTIVPPTIRNRADKDSSVRRNGFRANDLPLNDSSFEPGITVEDASTSVK